MTRHSRRNALIGAAAALPATWSRPLIQSVVLPAHAQMSVEFTIDCTVEDADGACTQNSIEFRVFGTVFGGDLAGVVLEIEYTNELDGGGIGSDPATTIIQSGNTFDATLEATPPSGEAWSDQTGLVTVRFQDQSTFGTAECSNTHFCGPPI